MSGVQASKVGYAAKISSGLGQVLSRGLLRRAMRAMGSGHHAEALGFWRSLMKRAPYWPQAYLMVASLAREVGDLQLCEDTVERGLSLFPQSDVLVAEAAGLAERKGQWDKSVALWSQIVERPNASPVWLQCYAHDLMVLGKLDLVDALLPIYQRRFPEHAGFLAVQGMVASARGNYDRALALWSKYRSIHPNDPAAWDHYGRAYQARELDLFDRGGKEGKAAEAIPLRIDVVSNESVRELLLGFESIGSNCEFGLVQRRFGAEPPGLLRFNATLFGSLVSAVMHRFEGMGDPENTELTTLGNGEFFLEDRRWRLGMHTFLFQGQVDPSEIYEKLCKRVTFLKRKMLEDLTEARKVFVFLDSKLSLDDIQMLHRALRTIGDVALLHVRSLAAAPGGFTAGEPAKVDEIAPLLFVGFLSREGVLPNGTWDIMFEEWSAICAKTRAIVDGRKMAAAEAIAATGS